MKTNLRMLVAAFVASAGALGVQAQTAPYIQQLDDFGGSAATIGSFIPGTGDYTLEVDGTAGTPIVVKGAKFTYTPTATGKVRFVKKAGTVYVYEGNTYVATVATETPDATTFPEIYAETDNSEDKTGIYDVRNLFLNPGFESLGEEIVSGSYKANNWDCIGYSYGSRSRARVDVADFGGYEGHVTFMMHGYGSPAECLSQTLPTLQANTTYKIAFTTWSHSNTTNGTYAVTIGTSAGNSSVASSTINTGSQGYTKTDQTVTFTTGTEVENLVFAITRQSTAISHFDRMTMVAATSEPKGIEGTTSAMYLAGTAYAPVSELAEGDATSLIVNPSFETGSLTPWVATSQSDMGVKPNSNDTYNITNADGNYVFNTWSSGTGNFSVKQTLTGLPEGYYTVTALAATDGGSTVSIYAGSASVDVNPSAKETGIDGTTARVHVTDGTLEIGAKSSTWFKVDNFRLNYYTTPDLSELANRWKEAHDAAVAAQSNTDYADVNGVAKATLDTEVAKAEPTTADAYEAAITALNDATEAFIAAEKDYKALKAEIATASGLDTDVDAANALLTSTTATAAEVAEGVNTLKVAEYNKVNDTYTADVTDTYIGEWTSDMATVTGGQHWDGTNTAYYEQSGSDWGASSWTRAMSQSLTLPAGKYMLKVAGRSSTDAAASMTVDGTTVNFPNKGDAGYGITLDGATSFSASDSYANSNNGRGWEWRYIPFELSEDGTANISLGGTTNATHQWMSITSITLLTIPETITLDEDVNYTAEAKAAANVTLKRTLTADKYATFCIPFNMTAEQIAATFGEGTEVSELTSITETDINFDAVATITANKPCILLPQTTASSFDIEGVSIVEPTNSLTETVGTTSMIGSYAAVKYLPTSAYYLKNNSFYTAPDETVSIAGFRAYLVSGGGAKPKNIVINGNNVTGIDGINADENAISGDIYTLGGQLVRKNATTTDGLAKGIYIVNGKKVVVK